MKMLIVTKKIVIFTIDVTFRNEFETRNFHFCNTPTVSLESYMKHVNSSHIFEMIIKTISDIRNIT